MDGVEGGEGGGEVRQGVREGKRGGVHQGVRKATPSEGGIPLSPRFCACCVVYRLPLSSHCPHTRQAFASEAMAIIGEALGLPHDRTALYRSTSDVLREPTLLNRLHRDPVSGHFLDYGLHSEDVGLGRRSYPVDGKMQVWRPHIWCCFGADAG